jgi:hypothetical protein
LLEAWRLLKYKLAVPRTIMTCGLETVFGDTTRNVPDGPPGEHDYVFRSDTLPAVPPMLETARLLVRKTHHDYNCWHRADRLIVYLDKDLARQLGVFLLACAFHRPSRATLALRHPSSDVREIVYRSQPLNTADPPVGLSVLPFAFRYFPSVTRKHPWWNERETMDLPLVALSTQNEFAHTDDEWRGRNTLFLESSLLGTVRFAELLLNAGCSWNQVNEYELEGDAGFRGVAPMSAELLIVMPGSTAWISHPDGAAVATGG